MLSSGLVFADESGAFSSPTFTTAEAGFHLDYGSDQMTEHAIDERTIDRLELFERVRQWPVYSVQCRARPPE